MPFGLLFWILMILWLVVDAWRNWPVGPPFASSFLLFILIMILGWHAFGPPVRP